MILTAFAFHLALAAASQPETVKIEPPEPAAARDAAAPFKCQSIRPPVGRRPPAPPPPRQQRRRGKERPPRLGPGGLRAHENSLGHCCRKHIGRTPEQLRIRLRREKHLLAASTFYNMRTAQMSLRVALLRHTGRVNDWLRRGAYGQLEIWARMPNPVGIYLIRGAARPREGRTAIFRLQYSDYYPHNFQVVTGMVKR